MNSAKKSKSSKNNKSNKSNKSNHFPITNNLETNKDKSRLIGINESDLMEFGDTNNNDF